MKTNAAREVSAAGIARRLYNGGGNMVSLRTWKMTEGRIAIRSRAVNIVAIWNVISTL